MNKELEEAKDILKEFIKRQQEQIISCCFGINKKSLGIITEKQLYAIEIVLNYIENSIPKQLVEEKIEESKKQSGGNVFHVQQTINSNIRLLQELLEGK